jgi:hypothetical protein
MAANTRFRRRIAMMTLVAVARRRDRDPAVRTFHVMTGRALDGFVLCVAERTPPLLYRRCGRRFAFTPGCCGIIAVGRFDRPIIRRMTDECRTLQCRFPHACCMC